MTGFARKRPQAIVICIALTLMAAGQGLLAAGRTPLPGVGFVSGATLTAPFAYMVKVADFNLDGNRDVAAVNLSSANTITVILGNGNGTFRAPSSIPVGTAPGSLAAGDLNNDGRTDIVVTNFGSGSVSVLLGRGDGTFLPAANIVTGVQPFGITILDLNNDGRADVVSGNRGGGSVSVLQGRGDGTFLAPVAVTVGGNPEFVGQGDFNSDGNADIAVVNEFPATVYVLLGRGDGTFRPATPYTVSGEAQTVAIADLDNDGNLDIVSSNTISNNYSVLLGVGDGTFRSARNSVPGASGLSSVAVADINGDCKADLVTTNFDSGTVSVLIGNGDATFQSPLAFSSGGSPQTVAVGDFDSDGRADLAVGSVVSGTVRILRAIGGNPTSTILTTAPPATVRIGAGVLLRATVFPASSLGSVTFYDGGTMLGSAPLVAGLAVFPMRFPSAGSKALRAQYSGYIVYGNANASYDRSISATVNLAVTSEPGLGFQLGFIPSGGNNASGIAIGDFNVDGKPDLVVTNKGSNSVAILQGNGLGSFSPVGLITGFANPTGVAIGDFNSDDAPDIVVANNSGNTISVLLGNGDLTFRPARTYNAVASPWAVAVGDVNGDGRADIIVMGNGTGGLAVFLGNCDGTLKPAMKTPLEATSYNSSILVGDFDRDGVADVAVTLTNSDRLVILPGVGDGTFGPQQFYAVQDMPQSLAQGDFNNDGIVDLAVCNYFVSTVSVFPGSVSGAFGTPSLYPAGVACHSMVAGDFNGDGRLDLALSGYANTTAILRNNGNGGFLAPQTYGSSSQFPITLATADLNGDGRADLVTANNNTGNIEQNTGPGSIGVLLGIGVAPASITATAGAGQSVTVNTVLATALEATVRDASNAPLASVAVLFTAPSSGASGTWAGNASVTVLTDSSGKATAPPFTANGVTGSYNVVASAGALTATFALTNAAGGSASASITATAGSGQSAVVNTSFPVNLQATARDASGNPSAGVAVTFTAPATGPSGTFAAGRTAVATTDASGRATAPAFTANGVAGSYNVTAALASGPSTTFALTNTDPGTPTLIGPPIVGFNFTPDSPPSITRHIVIDGPNSGSTRFTYRVVFPNKAVHGWLSVAPSSLSTPAVLAITATPGSLMPGTYLAYLVVSSGASLNPALAAKNAARVLPRDEIINPGDTTIAASLTIADAGGATGPLLFQPRCIWVSSDTPVPATPLTGDTVALGFGCTRYNNDSSTPSSFTAAVNANSGPQTFSAALAFGTGDTGSWLSAKLRDNPISSVEQSDTTNAPVSGTIRTDLLTMDRQHAFISTTDENGRSGGTGLVTVATGPTVTVYPSDLTFDSSSGQNPQPVAVTLTAVLGTFNFTVRSTVPWLSVAPSSGTVAPGTPVVLSASPVSPPAGVRGASIVVDFSQVAPKPAQALAVAPPTQKNILVALTSSAPGRPLITSVVNGGSFQPPVIAPGAWVTIKGTNLANTGAAGRTWDPIEANRLPTSLGGVSVTINGKPAYVQYISPGQINVVAPGDTAVGPVDVVVTNNGQASAAVAADLRNFSPAFFQWGATRYAVAQRYPNSDPVANPAVLPIPGVVSAAPGDIIILWVTGLGPTLGPPREGLTPAGGSPVSNPPSLSLGGVTVPIIAAAVSEFAATYQVSFTVPANTPIGDVPVRLSVGGLTSPDGIFLHVVRR